MSGGIAGRGRPGPAGPAGPMGPTGPQGEPAFTLAIGEVSAVPYGQEPAVTNVGTDQNQVWDLALVTGATGVLTGAAPPTGSDGTSLGQLYFCTTNQVYYGLIELDENNNKWSPIMTQEGSRLVYDLALLAEDRAPSGGSIGDIRNIGHVTVVFDEVRQKCTAMAMANYGQPINRNTWIIVDTAMHTKIRALANQRGIINIPVSFSTQTNGTSTTATFELLSTRYGIIQNVGDTGQMNTPGDGNTVAMRTRFQEGVVDSEFLESGAPGASEFGSYPYKPYEEGTTASVLLALNADPEYPVVLYMGSSTTVVYDE